MIFLIGGIAVLLVFLLSLSIIHIRSLRDDLNNRWYNLTDKLQYRQDLIPNLIETVRTFIPKEKLSSHQNLIQETIDARILAAKNLKPGSEKILQEHALSKEINALFSLGQQYDDLGKSTNYLELKKEFKDIKTAIQDMVKDYNFRVRHHNSVIKRPYNVLPAVLMRFSKKHIFSLDGE